jgi:N-acetylmuramoyl-L-alanine amidase
MRSYRHPSAVWLGSPNFTPGRNGHDMGIQPAYVVLHTMVGTVAGADARFQQASEQASATYGVGLDGRLYQWVDEADAPWTNGTWENPGSNADSVTIEHEDAGDFDGPRTPELYAASAALVHDICTRYGIPIDREHVIGHRECAGAATACPDALDMDRIVAAAAAGGDMLTPDEHKWLQGLFNGWFPHDRKLDAILAAVGLLKPIDVDQLAADLVAHLPAGADAQAVATAVVDHLAQRLQPAPQAQVPPPPAAG